MKVQGAAQGDCLHRVWRDTWSVAGLRLLFAGCACRLVCSLNAAVWGALSAGYGDCFSRDVLRGLDAPQLQLCGVLYLLVML